MISQAKLKQIEEESSSEEIHILVQEIKRLRAKEQGVLLQRALVQSRKALRLVLSKPLLARDELENLVAYLEASKNK
jgi:hypothetical protein